LVVKTYSCFLKLSNSSVGLVVGIADELEKMLTSTDNFKQVVEKESLLAEQ